MAQFTTLTEMFDNTLQKYGNSPLFFDKDKNKKFKGIKFKDAYKKAENVALGLMELGLSPQDCVGLMADNKPEWAIADMAVLMNGSVDTPRGTDSTAQEMEYILNHSESRFCFVEDDATLEKVQEIISSTQVEHTIILAPGKKKLPENVYTLDDIAARGEKLRDAKLSELKKRKEAIKPDDLFTIIYTSGTTGDPKGVMLTHANMVYNVAVVPSMVGLRRGDRTLSILPVWHIFERAIDYASIALGVMTYYTNIRDLREDFTKVQPTFMASAPRLWENIYQGIKNRIEKSEPMRRLLFDFAYELNKLFQEGLDYLRGWELQTEPEPDEIKIRRLAWSVFTTLNLFVPAQILDGLVFSKLREAMGGKLKGTISGGGALPGHVDEFFNIIGLPVYEGYGMTECAPIISVRPKNKLVKGSVGVPPDGTEVRVFKDDGTEAALGELGVIWTRGPQVMKGYYKNKQATDEILKDGWLNTGDLGFISYNGTLSVRGRAKDTIVLLGGENVEPTPIENALVENEWISQAMVVGQDKKNLAALIWPDTEKLKEQGFSIKEGGDLNKNKEVRSKVLAIVKKAISSNQGFKSFERVADFRFLPKPMEVGDELTNLYKMKRKIITEKYQDLIEDMYK